MNSIFAKSFAIALSVMAISCQHSPDKNSQFFLASREEIWEALVAILKSYPLKTIDEQKGYIETKELKANQFWKGSHQKNQDFFGYRSVISVQLNYEKPIAKVFIHKKIYQQKGFISSKREVPSDFLEEAVLLYRLGRELKIRRKLQ